MTNMQRLSVFAEIRAEASWWAMLLVVATALAALRHRTAIFRFARKAQDSAPGPGSGREFIFRVWRAGFYVVMGGWLVAGLIGFVLAIVGPVG